MKRHRKKTVVTEEWVEKPSWIEGGLKALSLTGRGILYLCGRRKTQARIPNLHSKHDTMQWLLE